MCNSHPRVNRDHRHPRLPRRHGKLDALGAFLRQLLAEAAKQEYDHWSDHQ
jgi:hypothetical protein